MKHIEEVWTDGVLVETIEHDIPDPAPPDDLAAQVEALQAQLDTALAGLAAATSLAQVRNTAKAAQAAG